MCQCSLERLAPELLCRIASHLVTDDSFVGPPSSVLAFLSACKSIHRAVAFANNAQFLAHIFAFKFDCSAPLRRLGPRQFTAVCQATELRKRFETMSRIRTGFVCQERQTEDLWTMLLMLLEDDGRNGRQLIEWARLPDFILKIFRALNETCHQSNSYWSIRSPTFSLALWILCLLTELGTFSEEQPEDAAFLKTFLHPIVVSAYRFPSVHAPEKLFRIGQTPQSNHLGTGPYNALSSIYCHLTPTTSIITHFATPLAIAEPPPNAAAFLAMIIRLDGARASEYSRASSSTTADVIQAETNTPHTEEILHETSDESAQRSSTNQYAADLPPALPTGGRCRRLAEHTQSRRFDSFWCRLTSCVDPRQSNALRSLRTTEYSTSFVPGAMCGRWSGKMMIPDFQAYHDLITDSPSASALRVALYQRPMTLCLREHHSFEIDSRASSSDDSGEPDSFLNAWFPEDTVLEEDQRHGNLSITHPKTLERTHYVTYRKQGRDLVSNGSGEARHHHHCLTKSSDRVDTSPSGWDQISDIVLTGETDEESGELYGHYTFVGRVRAWDGLVVLLRKPMFPEQVELGRWVFSGYLMSTGVLLGRWRDTCTGMTLPSYEGPFVLSFQGDC